MSAHQFPPKPGHRGALSRLRRWAGEWTWSGYEASRSDGEEAGHYAATFAVLPATRFHRRHQKRAATAAPTMPRRGPPASSAVTPEGGCRLPAYTSVGSRPATRHAGRGRRRLCFARASIGGPQLGRPVAVPPRFRAPPGVGEGFPVVRFAAGTHQRRPERAGRHPDRPGRRVGGRADEWWKKFAAVKKESWISSAPVWRAGQRGATSRRVGVPRGAPRTQLVAGDVHRFVGGSFDFTLGTSRPADRAPAGGP